MAYSRRLDPDSDLTLAGQIKFEIKDLKRFIELHEYCSLRHDPLPFRLSNCVDY
jgi:hypothetical protein